jgi:hypothetical protein
VGPGGETQNLRGEEQKNVPALKVPRLYPLVLLVEVRLRPGKALGSEKCSGLGCGLCCEQRRGVGEALYCA